MTDDLDTPRLRQDGSIDTAFYMTRGRVLRSEQAHRMLGLADRDTDRRAAPRRRFLFL